MSLQEFLIEEEELDVFQRVIGSQAFSLHLPIPPPLLAKDISLDRELAPQVFPQAIAEWKRRLGKKQWSEEENVCVQKYISAKIAFKRESYRIEVHPIPGGDVTWFHTETGFTHALSIGRNSGGSLYFNNMTSPRMVHKQTVLFSPQKISVYKMEGDDTYPRLFCYDLHNVDSVPGALLLLSWGRQYINAALHSLEQSVNA